MVTMKDIGREAGVTPSVVSAVLNQAHGRIKASPETAARIHSIAARLNYRPNLVARQLVGKKSGIIGVVMDTCAPKIYHDRLSHMELYAAKYGYRFMIGEAHNDVKKVMEYARFFAGYGVDGMICMAHAYPGRSHEIAAEFLSYGKTVFFEDPDGFPDAFRVTIDVADPYYQAVKYLAAQGRRRIGLFRIDDFYSNLTMDACQSGYLRGLEETGLPFDAKLIQKIPIDAMRDVNVGLPKIKKLLEQKAEAVICVNDYMAAVAIWCLQELQVKIPEQFAVVGSDNLDFSALMRPAITTFEQHNDKVATALIDQLIGLLNDRPIAPEKGHVVIKPTFIKRQSA